VTHPFLTRPHRTLLARRPSGGSSSSTAGRAPRHGGQSFHTVVVICLALSKNEAMDMREMARVMGRRGGRARARRLSAERRRQIASLGGQARHRSLQAARRIVDNLRYAAAVLELRGGVPRVLRMKTFSGRLPGLYPGRS
jgi:hypothetical protein